MNYNGLKDAIEYVFENMKLPNKTMKINGTVYADHEMIRVAEEDEPDYHAEPLKIATLNGFIDYVQENRDHVPYKMSFVQVTGPSCVRLISIPDEKCVRDVFVESCAELPDIEFGKWINIEQFMIMLQSCFAPSDDRETIMRYVGNIKEDEGVQLTDDGISQKIVAKTGVASVEGVILPNPVKLRPFRTFQELEQPESEFVLRIRKGGEAALFESDGGKWRVDCRTKIKAFLSDALKDVEGICVIS